MSKGTILITDNLFVLPEHEEKLRNAGYDIERIDKPDHSEEELKIAIKGKIGYILGGIEKITDGVIEAADELKVISLTYSDWMGPFPGYEKAKEKGIIASNCIGCNSYAVAEYSVTNLMAMVRDIFSLSRTGKLTFKTTNSLCDMTVGIIGMGKIGTQVAKMLKGLGTKRVIYYSRTRKEDLERELGIEYVELENLIMESDAISQHVPTNAGEIVSEEMLEKTKKGVIIINNGAEKVISSKGLLKGMKDNRIRVFQDHAEKNDDFDDLPINVWQRSNASTAFNTKQAIRLSSDIVTNSMINLLSGKEDKYKVF